MDRVGLTPTERAEALARREARSAEFLKAHRETIRHALNNLDTPECRSTRAELNKLLYHA